MRGYDFLIDEDVDVEVVRFENRDSKLAQILGDDFPMYMGNQSSGQKKGISELEMYMIKQANPTEWEMYGVENSKDYQNLLGKNKIN